MKSLLSVLAGGCYSLAYMAPKPYWIVALAVSALLVTLMRGI